MKLLFVCLGNICRSPAAEGVMRGLEPDWQIDSAGTGGWHIGKPPYAPMQDAAAARGIDLSPLRARQFSAADFNRFDLIVAMDAQNLQDIEAQRPGGAGATTRCLIDGDVPDPYYTRDFTGALDIIEKGCARLQRDIAGAPLP